MLNITIDDDARHYILQQDATLTLRTSPRHGCCGGTVFLPIVEAGLTAGGEAWPVVEQDGIRIYIEPDLSIPDTVQLRVGLDRLLLMKRLWISGLDTTM
ncbi:MAG: CC/Se motif family (seleno)protein [Anaerolineae bacterium]